MANRSRTPPGTSAGRREQSLKALSLRAMLVIPMVLALLAWGPERADAARRIERNPGTWVQAVRERHYAVGGSRSKRSKSAGRSRHKAIAEREKRQPEPAPKGPLQVVISIGSQRISLYGGSELVARSVVSTGMRGHPTPMGVFSVIQKHKWHHSNIYSAAPMPYMQRITWSGVAMHAGVLPGYPASHGCIRLKNDFAIRLWQLTKIGTRVIVAREDLAPVEISHPRLFVPKPKPDPSVAVKAPGETLDQELPLRTAETNDAVKTADAAVTGSDAGKGAEPAKPNAEVKTPAKPISVFISHKQGKLFVRQGFKQLFDSPVNILDSTVPMGTHVFTAVDLTPDASAMRWTVVSFPGEAASKIERPKAEGKKRGRGKSERKVTPPAPPAPSAERARAALDRIEIPKEAIDRISELLLPQSSLIISDNALSDETDSDTDFIVLVR